VRTTNKRNGMTMAVSEEASVKGAQVSRAIGEDRIASDEGATRICAIEKHIVLQPSDRPAASTEYRFHGYPHCGKATILLPNGLELSGAAWLHRTCNRAEAASAPASG